MNKPEKLTEEHLLFLDDLRNSGKVNMFGARPFLKKKFKTLSDKEAFAILDYWMETFSKRHKEGQ